MESDLSGIVERYFGEPVETFSLGAWVIRRNHLGDRIPGEEEDPRMARRGHQSDKCDLPLRVEGRQPGVGESAAAGSRIAKGSQNAGGALRVKKHCATRFEGHVAEIVERRGVHRTQFWRHRRGVARPRNGAQVESGLCLRNEGNEQHRKGCPATRSELYFYHHRRSPLKFDWNG